MLKTKKGINEKERERKGRGSVHNHWQGFSKAVWRVRYFPLPCPRVGGATLAALVWLKARTWLLMALPLLLVSVEYCRFTESFMEFCKKPDVVTPRLRATGQQNAECPGYAQGCRSWSDYSSPVVGNAHLDSLYMPADVLNPSTTKAQLLQGLPFSSFSYICPLL